MSYLNFIVGIIIQFTSFSLKGLDIELSLWDIDF